ncbi:MAG TPA: carboxypeptidase M32 [Candidatus Krumholzibacteria bacterium]|nr:carboxypeptidase M32 [Candidatus Krumholzibacteria bacterium]HPD70780.1 carboxypeptidase M32 [Candidatus Krumholzibacteria bacterium]HRY39520.1 carboxypeptidase M32 [Candidatus Krumholzibacteria bacterium]
MPDAYARLLGHLQPIQRLNGARALLGWDQEVMMPPAGARSRADTCAALAEVVHARLTDPELGSLLADLLPADGLAPAARANVREARRAHERAVRLPVTLVRDLAEAASLAQPEWARARDDDDWDRFAPHLARVLDLKRQEAAALGIGDEPYDSLLDEFEPGARTADLLPIFRRLRVALTALLDRLGPALAAPVEPLVGDFPVGRQDELNRRVLSTVGYDFDAGRLDVSTHPFTESMGPGDVRITTRYSEDDVLPGLFSTLHEAGHALYEQGLPAEHRDTPAGQAVSLGIHESQSRLWENHVGRCPAFCHWLAPVLRQTFPERLGRLAPDELVRAVNRVRSTPIRIEADEVTYNLHIVLRLEIERALLSGDLEVAGVPAVWRSLAREYLGLEIWDERTGPLQDIHWSMGSLGYFPTYTLGNLYAAMFWNAARSALPDLDRDLAAGRTAGLLGWLRAQIHGRGSVLAAADLCRAVTGRSLDAGDFIAYLEVKYGELMGH